MPKYPGRFLRNLWPVFLIWLAIDDKEIFLKAIRHPIRSYLTFTRLTQALRRLGI